MSAGGQDSSCSRAIGAWVAGVSAIALSCGLAVAQERTQQRAQQQPAQQQPAQQQAPSAARPGAAVPASPLDDITVNATRNPIRAFEFPGMVTPVRRDEIEQVQPSNPRDLFFSVPGVTYGGGARRTGQTPAIRGFDGADIIVTIDGARQDWVTAHDGRFFIDPFLVRRADVVRGPTSVLFGSGGLGGTIAFDTLGPKDILAPGATFGVLTGAGGQSVNREVSLANAVAIRPFKHFALLAAFVGRNSGDIRLGNGVDLIAKDAVRSALVKGEYDDGEFKARATFLRFGNRPIEPGNPQVANPTAAFPLIRREVTADQLSAEARWAPPDNPLVDFGVRLYQVETRNDEKEFGPRPLFSRTLTTDGFTVDNRSRFMLGPDAGALLTVGVDGARNTAETSNLQGPGQNNGTPAGKTSLLGAFAQADVKWSRPLGLPGQLLLTPGIRYDTYESSNANNRTNEATALSPRIGASYAPVEWAFVFANVGRAFRAPTLSELYADGIHFRLGPLVVNRFVPNPDLKPQTALSMEAGVGLRFNGLLTEADSLRLKGSFYRADVSNLIDARVTQPTPPGFCFGAPVPLCARFGGTTVTRNVGKAEISGFEIEGRYDLGLAYIGGNMFTTDGKDKRTGASVGTLAPLIARVDGGLRFFEGQLTVGARATFASRFTKGSPTDLPGVDPAQVRPGYSVWDAYVRIQPKVAGLDGLKIDLGVDNVFDRPYEVVFANAKEPGRNFKGFVSYTKSW
jgi:hemoglobin/transferrin/lactoferrin receptor protein